MRRSEFFPGGGGWVGGGPRDIFKFLGVGGGVQKYVIKSKEI